MFRDFLIISASSVWKSCEKVHSEQAIYTTSVAQIMHPILLDA